MKNATFLFSLGCLLMFGMSHSDAAVFKARLLAEPATLDWNLAHTLVETPLMMNMMEGLTEVDNDLKPVPSLAETMTISRDQLTYTFTIRKNVKWSDGEALTAQHFLDGWKRLLSPGTAAPYAYLLFDVVGAEEFQQGKEKDFSKVGIQVVGADRLVVTLKKPVAYFPYLTGFWPLFPIRKELVEKYGNQWTRPGKLVTVGPYFLDSYQFQNKIVLKANPHYWRKMGNVTEVVIQIVFDSATALKVFRSGGIQMMQDFSPDDLKQAKSMVEFKTFPYLKTQYLSFRVKDSVGSDANLRNAIVRAIDRKPIPKVLNGTQKISTSFVPPRIVGHDSKMNLNFDVAAAKEFLKKSNFDPKTQTIEIVARNSERPRILTQYIQSELKKNLGIEVKIQLFDHKAFTSNLKTQNFAMMLMMWSADYPDGDSFLGLFESNTGNNHSRFSSEKFDQNLILARKEWNTLKREKLYREAQEEIQLKEAVILPLFYEENEALVARSVKGFEINPIGYYFIRKIEMN